MKGGPCAPPLTAIICPLPMFGKVLLVAQIDTAHCMEENCLVLHGCGLARTLAQGAPPLRAHHLIS